MNKNFIKLSLKVYALSVIIIYIISYVFSPTTYPIILLLAGNGRFDDWWNTITALRNYPEVVGTICTLPWVYSSLLKSMDFYFGILTSYIIYVIFTLAVLSIPYEALKFKYGRFYAAVCILSYPIMFGFWRGNSDFLIFGLVITAYLYGANNRYTSSVFLLGSAIAFKPYQFFLLFSYKFIVLKKEWMIISVGLLAIFSLILFGNENFFAHSYKEVLACGKWYNDNYAIGNGGSLHNNSLWGGFKFLIDSLNIDQSIKVPLLKISSIYLSIWPLVLLFSFFAAKDRFHIFLNDRDFYSSKFFLLCLLISILSPITPDYRLFLINICLIIFLINDVPNIFESKVIFLTLIFIILPKEFYWFDFGHVRYTPNGPMNFLAMFFLLFYVIRMNGLKMLQLSRKSI
jgi:hypothetical protein